MRWWDVEPAARLETELFPDEPWSERGFWSELAGVPQTRTYLVAEDDEDGLVGYAGLAAVAPEADVQTVAVRPQRQRAGVGALLLGALLDDAGARGCSQVLLEVAEGNDPARRLYERFGFEPIARRRGYYGPGRDAVVMRRVMRGRTP